LITGWDCVKHVKVGRGRCWACADEEMSRLQARVAELEAELASTERTLRQDYNRAAEECLALRTCIARAVAELETLNRIGGLGFPAHDRIDRARAILKGEA
jgi:hypothetical protein